MNILEKLDLLFWNILDLLEVFKIMKVQMLEGRLRNELHLTHNN